MTDLFFTVHGIAIPQGSTRAFIPKGWTRPVITAANAKTKPWRQEIAGCAKVAMEEKSFTKIERGEAVKVAAWFCFPRPKSVSKKIEHKTTKPDLDKLARSLLDALTGIVFDDDSQVMEMHVSKHFGDPETRIRVSFIE